MKLSGFSHRLKKPRKRWLIIRRVHGDSMLPHFSAGKIIFATGLFKRLNNGDFVIFDHDGLEKIKQIEQIRLDQVYLLGSNPPGSTDSRQFGWVDLCTIKAKVITRA